MQGGGDKNVAAVLESARAFHSRAVLAGVVVCHAIAGWALFQLLDRVRPPVPPPITVTLVAEPPPALEEPAETPPQPLPQADPAPVQPPKRVEAPPPPPKAPEPQPEPPPQAQLPVQPEPAPVPEPPPPVRHVEPNPAPLPPAPPPPVARAEPAPLPPPPIARVEPAPTAPAEPVRPQPPPVAVAPPTPPAVASAPVTEPLYGADYLRNPKPVYPLMSRRMGEQGVVLLRVFVTAAGDPREIVLKEGSGYARLDRAAQEVVQRWKFVPAKRGSQAVDAWVIVPIRFSLKG
jgi:periplasmic protein TonB